MSMTAAVHEPWEAAGGADVVRLTGVSARGYHGVLASERAEGQLFSVDVAMSLGERGAGAAAVTDSLEQAVDYGAVARVVADVIQGEPVSLIETLASRIADAVLAFARVREVVVTVHKPQAPIEVAFEDVSVTIVRRSPSGGTGSVPQVPTTQAGSAGSAQPGRDDAVDESGPSVTLPQVSHPTASVAGVGAAATALAGLMGGGAQAAEAALPAAAGAGALGEESTDHPSLPAPEPGVGDAPLSEGADGVDEPSSPLTDEPHREGVEAGETPDALEDAAQVEVPDALEPEHAGDEATHPGAASDEPPATTREQELALAAGVVVPEDLPDRDHVTAGALPDEPSDQATQEADPLAQRPQRPQPAVIALGGNVGGVVPALRKAVHSLSATEGVAVDQVAPLARTAAVIPEGSEPQPDYLNTVVLVTTTLSARELLEVCQGLESDAGRVRLVPKGPRTLDADLITYGSLASQDPRLTLPHPRAAQRAFVLVPWAQADPFAEIGEQSVATLAEQAPDRDGVRWLALDWLDSDHLPALPTGQYVAPSVAPKDASQPQEAEGTEPADPASLAPASAQDDQSAGLVPTAAPEPSAPQVPDVQDADGAGQADRPGSNAVGTDDDEGAAPVWASVTEGAEPGQPAQPAQPAEPERPAEPDDPADSAQVPEPAAPPAFALPDAQAGDEEEWTAPPSWKDVMGEAGRSGGQ